MTQGVARVGAPPRRGKVAAWLFKNEWFSIGIIAFGGIMVSIACAIGLVIDLVDSLDSHPKNDPGLLAWTIPACVIIFCLVLFCVMVGFTEMYALTDAEEHGHGKKFDHAKRVADAMKSINESQNPQIRTATELLIADLVLLMKDGVEYDHNESVSRIQRLEKLAEQAKIEVKESRRIRLDTHALEFADEVIESVQHARKELTQ